MASSQVQIASSPPFGCILRDRNRRDTCRENNVRAAHARFEKNLKVLARVRDHLRNCISLDSVSQENSQNQIDSWVANQSDTNSHQNLRCTTRNQKNNNDNTKEDDCLPNSARHLRVLDRWPARTIAEWPCNEARVSSPKASNSPTVTSSPRASNFRRENSNSDQVASENSVSSQNLGASSLVQIWEARLNRCNSMNANQNQGTSTSRSSSGSINVENPPSSEEPPRGSDIGESPDDRGDNQTNNQETMTDGESPSDRSIQSERTPSRGTDSDLGESERVRVADIIRRLTSGSDDFNDHEQVSGANESPTRDRRHYSAPDQTEQRCFVQVISSPRLRGRQAFADLLMQMERDRQRELDSLVERQAVSRFAQRGRLQSMLRLRCLQRCLAIQDQNRSQSTASDVIRLRQGPAVMHLRQKFSTGVEKSMAPQADAANRRAPCIELQNNAVASENSSTLAQLNEDGHHQVASATEQTSTPPVEQAISSRSEDLQEASSTASSQTSYLHSEETAEVMFLHDGGDAERAQEEEINNQQQLCLGSQETEETTTLPEDWDENGESEEQEVIDQSYYAENNYDWFSDISRPRSYWEELRQAWYQEVLTTSSQNEEIRQLLERRTVSTFLGSDMRDRMDRLMLSRLQVQTDLESNLEDEEVAGEAQERMNEWMLSYFQRDMHSAGTEEEEEEDEEEQDEVEAEVEQEEQEQGLQEQVAEEQAEEQEVHEFGDEEQEQEQEGSQFSHQYHEATNDNFSQSSSQMFSPSPMGSWSYRDLSYDTDQVTSTSTPTVVPSPSQFQFYSRDDQHSSFQTNHPQKDMELIYDLRGHMAQLRCEMSELRESIKCCMEMQLKLQQFVNQELCSVREDGKKSNGRATIKRSCCICYEMHVDSVLYRCGHMCTCLKCAHELQWSSGKCPICQAPIVDVVRVFMES